MLKSLALALWSIAFAAALFDLVTDVWQGTPVLYFVGAVVLGVLAHTGRNKLPVSCSRCVHTRRFWPRKIRVADSL